MTACFVKNLINLLTDFMEQSVEKVVAQVFKKFSAFYGTQKPITMLVRQFGYYALSLGN